MIKKTTPKVSYGITSDWEFEIKKPKDPVIGIFSSEELSSSGLMCKAPQWAGHDQVPDEDDG